MTLKNAVNVTSGYVKENGKNIPDGEKSSHVEIKPKSNDPTEGRIVKFKKLAKGFTTEVKLTR